MSVIASRYSEALFDLAIEENCLKDVYTSYLTIVSAFETHSEILDVLSHPEITLDEKVEIVKDAFGNLNAHTVNFICILVEKNRLREVYNVFEDFEILYNAHLKIAVAKVYSVNALDPNQIENLSSKLNKKLGKEIKIKNIVDKSLIGGMKIVIDNHVIDYSIKTKINNLSDELHKIQIR